MPSEPEIESELGYTFFGKPKLPRGQSYPLKRSLLDDFLRRERIASVTGVWFCGNTTHDSGVLSANYYGSRRDSGRPTLDLRVHSVPSSLRSAIEKLIVSTALPALAHWIRSFDDPSLLQSQLNHCICFEIQSDPAVSSSEQGAGLRLGQLCDYRWQRQSDGRYLRKPG
jgi:hypothetical protein